MTIAIVDGPYIRAGKSLSEAVDCSAGHIVRITVPIEWTPANMTFMISSDNNYFTDMYNVRGDEIIIVCKKDTAIIVPPDWLNAAAFIKFRSGTRNSPVPQKEERQFAIAIELPDGGAPAAASASRSRE